jgi:hypothetical protein
MMFARSAWCILLSLGLSTAFVFVPSKSNARPAFSLGVASKEAPLFGTYEYIYATATASPL